MNIDLESLGGRGTTVLLFTLIFSVHFIKSGGWGNFWGASVGEYRVK